MRRVRVTGAVLAVLGLLVGTLGDPGGAAAVTLADPSPLTPRTVRLEAGTHTAVRLAADGSVLSTVSRTFSDRTSATTTARGLIGGVVHLRVSTGVLAGRWVRESTLAYVPGRVGVRTYEPARSVRIPAGRYVAYAFDDGDRLTGTRTASTGATVVRASGAMVLDGRRYLRMATGPWAGLWLPGTLVAPSPIACRTGPRPAAPAPRVLGRVPSAGPEVALTFDLGGRTAPAASIVELLLLDRVCATVFPTGATARTDAGLAVLALIRRNPALFEVGNHTEHHCDLVRGGGGAACPATRPSAAFVRAELRSAEVVLGEVTGGPVRPYWRPPYGAHDSGVRAIATSAGYPLTVTWTIDPIDWRPRTADPPGPTALDIATRIRRDATSGSIVLLHLGGYETRDALPWAIAGLRERGLRPTTVSDLLVPG